MSNLTISGIQTSLHWEDVSANLKMFEEKIKSISAKTEIVVLPEMFSTGFSMKPGELGETMEGETVKWMKRIAAEKRIILTGSAIIGEAVQSGQSGEVVPGQTGTVRPGGGPEYFNRLIWMQPNGE